MFKKKTKNIKKIERQKRRSLLKKKLKWSFLLAFFLVIFISFLFGWKEFYQFLCQTSFFNLKKYKITGLNRIEEKEILSLAQIAPDSNLLALNLPQIGEKIKKHSWVKGVKLGRILPDKLKISIDEKVAQALVKLEKTFFIEKNGEIIKELSINEPADLPLITGFKNDFIKEEAFLKALQLLELSNEKKYFVRGNISEINFTPQKGYLIYLIENSTQIKLGFDDFDKKVDRLEKVLTDLSQKSLVAKAIDLNFSKKVVVKLKK